MEKENIPKNKTKKQLAMIDIINVVCQALRGIKSINDDELLNFNLFLRYHYKCILLKVNLQRAVANLVAKKKIYKYVPHLQIDNTFSII